MVGLSHTTLAEVVVLPEKRSPVTAGGASTRFRKIQVSIFFVDVDSVSVPASMPTAPSSKGSNVPVRADSPRSS